jgi:hypothetical protein
MLLQACLFQLQDVHHLFITTELNSELFILYQTADVVVRRQFHAIAQTSDALMLAQVCLLPVCKMDKDSINLVAMLNFRPAC